MNVLGDVSKLFSQIQDYWSPKIVGEVNDQYIKLAKLKGEFVRHTHQDEDEMFHVIQGSLQIELDGEVISLREGQFYIVKGGVAHRPVAPEECWVMLIEKKTTRHTGDVQTPLTKSIEEQF